MTNAADDFWRSGNFADAADGEWLAGIAPQHPFFGLAIDSRSIEARQVFAALRGEHVDGHDYLSSAAKAGAAAAIVDRRCLDRIDHGHDLPLLIVDHVETAMAKLARVYRDVLGDGGTRVIGITGSNGKTSTVRLLHAVVAASLKAHRSDRSFNNDLGLPLTLLNADPYSDVVICEMGVSEPGDMDRLVAMASPDAAILTSVGRSHLEGLGSVEGVAREKAKIFAKNTSFAAAPEFAENVELIVARAVSGIAETCRPTFRRGGVGPVVQAISTVPVGTQFSFDGVAFDVAMMGAHSAMNAALAIAVARWLGVRDDMIRIGLAAVEAPTMRLSIERLAWDHGAVTLLDDSYNANPDSMLAAIAVLHDEAFSGLRRVAVLGDMLELGADSALLHREVLEAGSSADVVVLVGPRMEAAGAVAGIRPLLSSAAIDALVADEIAACMRPGDIVLTKGSRGMRLDRVAHAIRQRSGGRVAPDDQFSTGASASTKG